MRGAARRSAASASWRYALLIRLCLIGFCALLSLPLAAPLFLYSAILCSKLREIDTSVARASAMEPSAFFSPGKIASTNQFRIACGEVSCVRHLSRGVYCTESISSETCADFYFLQHRRLGRRAAAPRWRTRFRSPRRHCRWASPWRRAPSGACGPSLAPATLLASSSELSAAAPELHRRSVEEGRDRALSGTGKASGSRELRPSPLSHGPLP